MRLRLRDGWNNAAGSVMDNRLTTNRVLQFTGGVSVEEQLAQLGLMGTERNQSVRWERTDAGAKEDAEVKQLDGRVVVQADAGDPVSFPWVGERDV